MRNEQRSIDSERAGKGSVSRAHCVRGNKILTKSSATQDFRVSHKSVKLILGLEEAIKGFCII